MVGVASIEKIFCHKETFEAMGQGDYNRTGMIAFVFSMVFTFVFFIYLIFIHPGVDLEEVPKTVAAEVVVAQEEVFDPSAVTEPWVSTPAYVKYGRGVYEANCMICHGNEGKGDGAAGAALNPKPRNFVEGQWKQGGSPVELFNTITKGIAGTSMAAFGHLSEVDRWGLVHYIQSITTNKVAGKPKELEDYIKSRK